MKHSLYTEYSEHLNAPTEGVCFNTGVLRTSSNNSNFNKDLKGAMSYCSFEDLNYWKITDSVATLFGLLPNTPREKAISCLYEAVGCMMATGKADLTKSLTDSNYTGNITIRGYIKHKFFKPVVYLEVLIKTDGFSRITPSVQTDTGLGNFPVIRKETVTG
jgi:hypothetical protein